ncbi:MAG: hypothetical protein ACFE8N_14445 [Promethearchaeota archaeon]
MRELKKYLWRLPLAGVIISLISLFFPAASFRNTSSSWDHTIYRWMEGFYYDKLITFYDQNSSINVRFYNDPIQLIPSIISSSLILLSTLFIVINTIKHKAELKQGVYRKSFAYIPPILIILSTIIWMSSMEFAENSQYDLSMWNRYISNLGVVGMFLGGAIIISGFFLIGKYIKGDLNSNPN